MERERGVSVVIATFNGERHILTQLRSIADQSIKPVEILVGDDGSEDRTLELVERFAADSDIPVRVEVNPRRLGYADNFLHTAKRASARLTAFADQDDKWFPERLAVAARALEARDSTLWVSRWVIADEELQPIPNRRFHTGIVERTAATHPLGVIHGSRLVFRSDLLDHLPGHGRPVSLNGDGPAHHDEWICFAARVLGNLVLSQEPLMLYRRHPAASSAANPGVPSRAFLLGRVGEAPLYAMRQAASERADYLRDRLRSVEDVRVRARMLTAVSTYEELVPRLARRAATGSLPRSGVSRAAALLTNVLRGDYGRLTHGRLGVWALAQDLYNLR
jgi:glycosyltransferase involved in cell wall biosynthesis